MNQDRWNRIQSAFEAAIAALPEKRPSVIERECEGDPELKSDVERMLCDHEAAGSFLEVKTGVNEGVHDWAEELVLPPDRRIGSYVVGELIGRGGMGAVYRAQQTNPSRTVALKVVRPGLSTAASLRRLDHEAELLGRLQHPGIARIYEAGTFQSAYGAQPYFVMDLVEGEPIAGWTRSRAASSPDCLRLLLEVCDAVEHAHQRAVIHRDLKPANILVDDAGRPHVVDFGVGRMLGESAETTLAYTHAEHLLGTIPYASPEQLAGPREQVDTRSDVYALGVIAYELLGGRPPLDVKGKSLAEALVACRDTEPPPLGTLNRSLRGDVETIVAKAMAKEIDARYQSVTEFAADIRRYLAHEPIQARRAGGAYRLRKYARRHPAVVSGLVAAIATLVVGSAATAWQAIRAMRQETKTQLEAANVRAVNTFLTAILRSPSPRDQGRDVKVIDVLNRASDEAPTVFGDNLGALAAVEHALAESYLSLGEHDAAQQLAQAAFDRRQSLLGPDDPWTIESLMLLSTCAEAQGRLQVARTLYGDTLERSRRTLGPDHLTTLNALVQMGSVLTESGALVEAEQTLREALKKLDKVLGLDDPRTITCKHNLAFLLYRIGRFAEAEPLFGDALAAAQRAWGNNAPDTLAIMQGRAQLYSTTGRSAEAAKILDEVVEIRKRVQGEQHPDTLVACADLANDLSKIGQVQRAEGLFLNTLRAQQQIVGLEHPNTLKTTNNLAVFYMFQKRPADADPHIRRALEMNRRTLGEGHPSTILSLINLAASLLDQGRLEDAEGLFHQALIDAERFLPEDHQYGVLVGVQYGRCLAKLGRHSEALALQEKKYELARRTVGPDHALTASLVRDMASNFGVVGRFDDAYTLTCVAVEIDERVYGPDHPFTLTEVAGLAGVLEKLDRQAEAEKLYERAIRGFRKTVAEDHPTMIRTLSNYAAFLLDQKRPQEAEPILRTALEWYRREFGEANETTILAMSHLARALEDQGRHKEAAELHEQTRQIAEKAKQ